MEQTPTTAEALVRLEEPFASKDVKWLVAATSRDGRKGRVTPYPVRAVRGLCRAPRRELHTNCGLPDDSSGVD